MFGKRVSLLIAVLLVCVMLVSLAGCGGKKEEKTSGAAGGEVTLRLVSAWPGHINMNDGLRVFEKLVNERGKGKIQIKLLGGPEVIPAMEQVKAVKNGTVDMAWLPATYMVSLVPEANCFELTRFTPAEERKNGFFENFNEIFAKKANAIYLGRGTPGLNFNLYTNFPVTKLEDFKGKMIRVTPAYKELVRSIGASPAAIEPGEVYSALERGVVEGYGWPATGVSDWGWDAKTKYIIEPGFYQVDVFALINKSQWDKLSAEQKKVLNDAAIEMENQMEKHFKELAAKERKVLTEKGIKVMQLSPEDSKVYLQHAFDAVMEVVMKSSPEYGPKLKAILTPK